MAPCEDGTALIPRLNVSVPLVVVEGALLGAFVQLGYRSLNRKDKEEAILEFVKGRDVFVSLP